MDHWKFLTILVGALAAYIAFQQYRINRERFKLDLFEKRFSVFSAVRKLLSIVLRDAKADYTDLFEYRASTAEATFLFGNDITDYLAEIDKQFLRLHVTEASLKGEITPDVMNKMIAENQQALTWLTDQLPELKERFSPYLRFKVWKPWIW
jgi:uncharacterized coiled-coil protein SlyX